MNKHKVKAYAKALALAILEDKKKDLAKNFFALLEKNKDIKKAKEIILLAEKEVLKKSGNKKITFETARKIKDITFFGKVLKKGDIVEEKIDPALIAGVKITVDGEKQMDFSLKLKLDNIFK